jgi:hypothetical protein
MLYQRLQTALVTHNHATYSMKSTLRCISKLKNLFNLHLDPNVLFLEYVHGYVLRVLLLLPDIECGFSM